MAVIDGSAKPGGWEAAFAGRLASTLYRRGLDEEATPLAVAGPQDLEGYAARLGRANCLVLFGADDEHGMVRLRDLWEWLRTHIAGPKLLAVAWWQHYDDGLSQEMFNDSGGFAPLFTGPKGPADERETGLFLLKFFTELDLHSEAEGAITGRMAWFAWSKARELLRRRGLPSEFSIRA